MLRGCRLPRSIVAYDTTRRPTTLPPIAYRLSPIGKIPEVEDKIRRREFLLAWLLSKCKETCLPSTFDSFVLFIMQTHVFSAPFFLLSHQLIASSLAVNLPPLAAAQPQESSQLLSLIQNMTSANEPST